MHRKLSLVSALIVFVGLASGCSMMKGGDHDAMSMKTPRPAELDQLDSFLGKWEGTATMKMRGSKEEMTTKGSSEAVWACDKWALVETGTFEMGEMGPMKSFAVWTWDPGKRRYRSTWIDSGGSVGAGWATYNDKTKTWCMKSKSSTPHGTMYGKGCVTMTDAKTMEWCWQESVMGGLVKVMEMKGVSRKQ